MCSFALRRLLQNRQTKVPPTITTDHSGGTSRGTPNRDAPTATATDSGFTDPRELHDCWHLDGVLLKPGVHDIPGGARCTGRAALEAGARDCYRGNAEVIIESHCHHCAKPTRRNRSWKRGSLRSGSKPGSTLRLVIILKCSA
jgi:hypothetical protein